MSLRISSGKILVYHLFTLADAVDLDRLRASWGAESTRARLVSRRATPEYIQFQNPPVSLPLGLRTVEPARGQPIAGQVVAKLFDFGVVSLRWEIPTPDNWEDLVTAGRLYIDNPAFEVMSRRILDEIRPRLLPALKNPYDQWLHEDYTIFYVHEFGEIVSAQTIMSDHADDLARLIRGEEKTLSPSEQTEVLRQRISYFDDDLAVIDWNAAFIYDHEGGSEHIDILEFANTELLELRYYDSLLDRELDTIYHAVGAQPRGWTAWIRNDFQRTSSKVMRLMVDVIELTEQIENALKIIGDLYSARVYRAIAERLRLREWEESIEGKIKIASQIYQVLNEQVDTGRFVVLEVIIILLIAIETVLLVVLSH